MRSLQADCTCKNPEETLVRVLSGELGRLPGCPTTAEADVQPKQYWVASWDDSSDVLPCPTTKTRGRIKQK